VGVKEDAMWITLTAVSGTIYHNYRHHMFVQGYIDYI